MTNQLKSIKSIYSKYIGNSNYLFKSVTIGNDALKMLKHRKIFPSTLNKSKLDQIIVLKKLPSTITTLDRKSVVNKTFAQGRGNEFFVEEIIDKTNPIEIYDSTYNHSDYVGIQYNLNAKVKYTKGSIVKIADFDMDLENNNSSGIHFFSSIDCAYYNYNKPHVVISHLVNNTTAVKKNDLTFEVNLYTPDGFLVSQTTYPFGKHSYYWYNSLYKIFEYKTALCETDLRYSSDIKVGEARQWHTNGQLKSLCNFANAGTKENFQKTYCYGNFKDGIFKEYYDNSSPKIIGQYKNGYRCGEWKIYLDNGNLHSTVTFGENEKKLNHNILSKQTIYFDQSSPFYH